MKTTIAAIAATSLVVGAVVAGASGGIALADARIGSGQIAKDAVKAKHIARGAVRSAEIHDRAVTSAKIKPGAVGGTQVDESTLGTVPNAAKVGGIAVTPITTTVAQDTSLTLYDEGGMTVALTCDATSGDVEVVVSRAAVSARVVAEANLRPDGATIDRVNENSSVMFTSGGTGSFAATQLREDGGFTALEFTGIYSDDAVNVFDCYFRGTMTVVD